MIPVGDKRELRFERELRFARQRDYDIEDYDLVPFTFKDAGDRRVYRNFNLSIFVDDYCNADCKFCVAQLRYAQRGMMYKKPHISDGDAYLARLDEVLRTIRPLDPSVSITGGEPTLSPLLPDILRMVDAYGFRKRTITTNGSGLLREGRDGNTVLDDLLRYGWNHLNISRASHNDMRNREIMRFSSDSEYCTMEDIRDILSLTKGTPLAPRMSCLLLRDGVDSVDAIKKYVDFYASLGADNFIFRELMDYDRTAVNREKIEYCDANKVRLNDIWGDFEKFPEFVPYLNILGYYYYVEIYKYRGMTIASESADLNQQYAEKGRHPDVTYEMIFHNNGNLCGGWLHTEEVLDEYRGPVTAGDATR